MTQERKTEHSERAFGMRSRIGLALGPVLFLVMFFLPAPDGLSPAGWNVAATTVLMATWWITEAIQAIPTRNGALAAGPYSCS